MSICWLFFDEIDSLFLDQCARLILYQSLRRDTELSLKKILFDRFLHEKWAIAQNSNTAPKSKAYHSIPQVKKLLIKLAWSIMLVWWNPKMCRLSNLMVPFLLWFAGFNRFNIEWTHQSLFSPHSQAIQNGSWRWLHPWRDEVSMRCLLEL